MTAPSNRQPIKAPTNDKELVQWWRAKIDLGIKWRWRTSGEKDVRWSRYKAYYRGDWGNNERVFDIAGFNLDEYLPTNRVFAYIRSIVPKVYFRNPGIFVSKGLILNGNDDAFVIQDVAEYLTRELKLKAVIKETVLNTMLLGTGVGKRGYGSQYVVGLEASEEEDRRLEHATQVKRGLPWARTVDPVNFVVPFGTKIFDDAPWCAHGVWRMLEFAQDDKNYKNRIFKATKKPNFNKLLVGSGDTSAEKDGQLWVRLWEIHDKTTGQLLIISDGSTAIHYKGDDVLQIEGLPFEVLIFDKDPDTMWGISTVKIMEPQQLELNDVKTMMAKYRRRDFSKLAVDPSVPNESIEALNDASDPLAAVKVPKPRENIMMITSQMPPDLVRYAQEIDDDIRLQIGFSRNQAGEVSTGRRTAREIEVARQSAEIRNDERRDATSDFYSNTVNGLLQISFLLMDATMIKRITGGAVWHTRDKELLPYDLGLEVNPEESKPKSSQVERAEALELYGQVVTNPVVNPIAPLADVLESYDKDLNGWIDPELANIIAIFLQRREEKAKQGGQRGA